MLIDQASIIVKHRENAVLFCLFERRTKPLLIFFEKKLRNSEVTYIFT